MNNIMETIEDYGVAYEFVRSAWDNERTNSYSKLNGLMCDTLNLAINANMNFNKNDFENIYNKMRGSYWFHVSNNGKGYGEYFYRRSIIMNNTSAIKSFENWVKLKAFILKGKRMCICSKFYDKEFQYQVTGFSDDYKKIYVVTYKRNDRNKEGKRKLFNFTNKEWLEFRKAEFILEN